MFKFVVLSCAVAAAAAAPMQLPAGVSAAECPNYPECYIAPLVPAAVTPNIVTQTGT